MKELILPPEGSLSEEQSVLLEYTLYQEWLKMYLNHVKWHSIAVGSYELTLSDLLDEPFRGREKSLFSKKKKYPP